MAAARSVQDEVRMSKSVTRRAFNAAAGATLFSVITSRKGFSATTQQQSVAAHPRAEIGTISPLLHGSFAEHLGACVYGGIWVGKNSSIPNINGYRQEAVDYLKALGIPVLRWPGGCFADDYHWRDGIGPLEKRPKRVNIHWGNYTEDNSFGTHEFIGLCRLINAEPYLAGNVGSGTPEELRDWVEYCNYPSGSTLSDERAANGSPEPFNVKYWGVGNENWGCGGAMSPEDYASNFRRFRTYVRRMGDTTPFSIACGPNRNDVDWTRRFMESVGPNVVRGRAVFPNGFAMHYYSNGRDVPTKFTVENMEAQLSSFADIEEAIVIQRGLIDSYLQNTFAQLLRARGGPVPPKPEVHLIVDEWGVWDRMIPEEEKQYGRLWMQSTMRSAVAAGMGLNVFHRQADKLYMCNIAQTVNVLQSVLLAHENNCIRTSTYYAFLLQKPHRGKTAVRTDTGDKSPLGISVSASRKDNELVLTFINPKHDVHMKVDCGLVGTSASSGTAQILTHPDYNACNTFENPNVIVPKDHPVSVAGSRVQLDLPPVSMAVAQIRLAS
jgi:alpha-N-arabinofuranosidase